LFNVYGHFLHWAVLLGALICPIAIFTIVNMRKDPEARRAVLLLISRGMITVGEARLLAGVSRQLIHMWCRSKGIVPGKARGAKVTNWWRKALDEKQS
jgi:hypothetical protein